MYLQPLPYNIHFNYHIYYTTITTTTVTIIQNTLQISDTVYYYHTNSTTVQYSTYFRASGLEHLIELLAVSRDLLHLQSIAEVVGVSVRYSSKSGNRSDVRGNVSSSSSCSSINTSI